MGLFDRFKKPSPPHDQTPPDSAPPPTVEDLSYGVAYFILPHYAFNSLEKVKELWGDAPATAGPFMYLMACQARETEPDESIVTEFRASSREVGGRNFYILEHPRPEPVDLSDKDPIEVMESGESFTLAPYFSCILEDPQSGETALYILGQAPIGGGTTLRSVSGDGVNANHGEGPAPDLDAFIEAITPAN